MIFNNLRYARQHHMISGRECQKSRPGYRVMKYLICILVICGFGFFARSSWGEHSFSIPSINLSVGDGGDEPIKISAVMQLLFLFTVLSLAPAILVMLTSFTRIIIVLSLLRHALGTQQMPANQIIIGLSLFLTFFIMTPVWNEINSQALQPFINEEISAVKAFDLATQPIKTFMLKQTREKDMALFVKISKTQRPQKPDDIKIGRAHV